MNAVKKKSREENLDLLSKTRLLWEIWAWGQEPGEEYHRHLLAPCCRVHPVYKADLYLVLS